MQIDIQSSDLAEVSPVGGITEAAWQRGGTWDCQETTSPSGQCYTWTCDLQITEPAPQPHVNAASWWECVPLCEYVCVCTLLYAFLLLDRKRPRTRIHRTPSFFLLLFSTSRNQCQHILSIFLNFGCTEYGPQGFFSLYKVIQGVRTFIPHTFFQEQDLIAQNPSITFFRHFCFHDHSNFSFRALDWSRFNMG